VSRYLLSFDVEDWFHAHNLASVVDRGRWDDLESRVERSTRRLLDILDAHDTRATFFVLGWVADRYPRLVSEIDDRGHEIACHGYGHELLTELNRADFQADLERALDAIEPLVEGTVRGYRAPSFSITDEALEVILEMGFEYDSSAFIVGHHDRYGAVSLDGEEQRGINTLESGLQEVTIPNLRIAGRSIPWGGGGYFRFIPYRVFQAGVDRIAHDRHFVFYLHPWELDPTQPRLSGLPLRYRLRHYTNLDRTTTRLDQLLEDFDWEPIASVI
jgi:polysaccharide deacetylase family protein (PEP-CTERM system associated)